MINSAAQCLGGASVASIEAVTSGTEQLEDGVLVKSFDDKKELLFNLQYLFTDSNKSISLMKKEFLLSTYSEFNLSGRSDLYPRIIYPPNVSSRADKLEYESKKSLDKLSSPYTCFILKQIISITMCFIKKHKAKSHYDLFNALNEYCKRYASDKSGEEFPTHNEVNIKNIRDIYMVLEKILASDKDDPLMMLIILWQLPNHLLGYIDPEMKKLSDYIYCKFIIPERFHTVLDCLPNENNFLLEKGCFGLSELKSDFFDKLDPMMKIDKYYKAKEIHSLQFGQGIPAAILNMHKEQIPYISGISGMASACYSILLFLNLDLNSMLGKEIVEIFSAFIVGIGAHSYHECYEAFTMADAVCKRSDDIKDLI